jgi:hypothetical protein
MTNKNKEMDMVKIKDALLAVAVIAVLVLGWQLHAKSTESKHFQGQRFESIVRAGSCIDLSDPNASRYTPEDNRGCIGRSSSLWNIEALHDMESGIEFICADKGDHGFACFATGRNWK